MLFHGPAFAKLPLDVRLKLVAAERADATHPAWDYYDHPKSPYVIRALEECERRREEARRDGRPFMTRLDHIAAILLRALAMPDDDVPAMTKKRRR